MLLLCGTISQATLSPRLNGTHLTPRLLLLSNSCHVSMRRIHTTQGRGERLLQRQGLPARLGQPERRRVGQGARGLVAVRPRP